MERVFSEPPHPLVQQAAPTQLGLTRVLCRYANSRCLSSSNS